MMILNTSSIQRRRSRCKALIAELIGGEIACFKVTDPELVYANLDEAFGRTEADEEIQDLQGSQGLNLACILSEHQF
jgi:hypothetical protein